jgi:TetR/AcrR family transcriptional repressor of nem operon
MARRSKKDAALSRIRILREAARLFRLKGYRGANLDDVMRSAGLTAGTFYAHFPSKAALLAEALEYGAKSAHRHLAKNPRHLELEGLPWLEKFLDSYITPKHRDSVGSGCTLPPLISEIARSPEARKVLEERILRALRTKARGGGKASEDQLLASLSLAVGAVALSRAVFSRALSSRVLHAARRLAHSGVPSLGRHT